MKLLAIVVILACLGLSVSASFHSCDGFDCGNGFCDIGLGEPTCICDGGYYFDPTLRADKCVKKPFDP
ncbi:hypothetical protein EB796_002804 [Bugula neritina]|uniref:EGF-like domain-containing protein n=1 Tax=Bugula neritina TaxID=10212 RepID=A0A7J7KKR7_BUGNE|nr:hypothetical protein EB796_002804 [Bugula neritina]